MALSVRYIAGPTKSPRGEAALFVMLSDGTMKTVMHSEAGYQKFRDTFKINLPSPAWVTAYAQGCDGYGRQSVPAQWPPNAIAQSGSSSGQTGKIDATKARKQAYGDVKDDNPPAVDSDNRMGFDNVQSAQATPRNICDPYQTPTKPRRCRSNTRFHRPAAKVNSNQAPYTPMPSTDSNPIQLSPRPDSQMLLPQSNGENSVLKARSGMSSPRPIIASLSGTAPTSQMAQRGPLKETSHEGQKSKMMEAEHVIRLAAQWSDLKDGALVNAQCIFDTGFITDSARDKLVPIVEEQWKALSDEPEYSPTWYNALERLRQISRYLYEKSQIAWAKQSRQSGDDASLDSSAQSSITSTATSASVISASKAATSHLPEDAACTIKPSSVINAPSMQFMQRRNDIDTAQPLVNVNADGHTAPMSINTRANQSSVSNGSPPRQTPLNVGCGLSQPTMNATNSMNHSTMPANWFPPREELQPLVRVGQVDSLAFLTPEDRVEVDKEIRPLWQILERHRDPTQRKQAFDELRAISSRLRQTFQDHNAKPYGKATSPKPSGSIPAISNTRSPSVANPIASPRSSSNSKDRKQKMSAGGKSGKVSHAGKMPEEKVSTEGLITPEQIQNCPGILPGFKPNIVREVRRAWGVLTSAEIKPYPNDKPSMLKYLQGATRQLMPTINSCAETPDALAAQPVTTQPKILPKHLLVKPEQIEFCFSLDPEYKDVLLQAVRSSWDIVDSIYRTATEEERQVQLEFLSKMTELLRETLENDSLHLEVPGPNFNIPAPNYNVADNREPPANLSSNNVYDRAAAENDLEQMLLELETNVGLDLSEVFDIVHPAVKASVKGLIKPGQVFLNFAYNESEQRALDDDISFSWDFLRTADPEFERAEINFHLKGLREHSEAILPGITELNADIAELEEISGSNGGENQFQKDGGSHQIANSGLDFMLRNSLEESPRIEADFEATNSPKLTKKRRVLPLVEDDDDSSEVNRDTSSIKRQRVTESGPSTRTRQTSAPLPTPAPTPIPNDTTQLRFPTKQEVEHILKNKSGRGPKILLDSFTPDQIYAATGPEWRRKVFTDDQLLQMRLKKGMDEAKENNPVNQKELWEGFDRRLAGEVARGERGGYGNLMGIGDGKGNWKSP